MFSSYDDQLEGSTRALAIALNSSKVLLIAAQLIKEEAIGVVVAE
jgi:hypothetical protein